jgi:hypothetical protein
MKGHFVGVTAQQNGGWNRVENAKDSDADHQFFQLFGFGPALLFEYAPDACQTSQSGQQESTA